MTLDAGPEILSTDRSSWEIGPYHPFLPGPIRLKLQLDGEIIVGARFETGFLHRGLEKTIELHPWPAAIAYADHLDPEAAIYGELALCLAVEELAFLAPPPRALSIRVVLSELARVSSHLAYIVRIAKAVAADTMVHYVLRDRERLLDLFELLTGQRFSINFLRYGGVRADVTEGFIERVLETCEMLRARLKEYNDLFTFNHTFKRRTQGVGVIGPELVLAYGLTGPNARASGSRFDVRKGHPYTSYETLDFTVPFSTEGDCHARFLQRLKEISQSVDLLKLTVEGMAPGEFMREAASGQAFAPPPGEAYSRIESSRGMLGCHVVSDGGENPSRVQFSPPALGHIAIMPELIHGLSMEDLPVVLASLDLGIAEVDR